MLNNYYQILKARKRGYTFKRSHRFLSSKYDPITESERILANHSISEENFVIFVGFFPVYYLKDLLLNKISGGIIYDNCSILSRNDYLKTLEIVFPENIKIVKNTFLKIFIDNLKNFESFLSSLKVEELSKLVIIESPYLESKEKQSILKVILNWKNYLLKRETTEHYFSYLWKINKLMNTRIQDKVQLIENIEVVSKSKKVVLLVTSGNSLEKNIKQLQEFADYFPVIAIPSVLQFLSKHKIKVDFLISTDGGFANKLHFEYILSQRKKINVPLIAPFSIHSSILRSYPFSIYNFIDEKQDFYSLEKVLYIDTINFVSMNGSVTLSAIKLLEHLEVDKVITYGVDFSLTPFKNHVISNTFEERAFSNCSRFSSYENKVSSLFANVFKEKREEVVYKDEKLLLYEREYERIVSKSSMKIINSNSISRKDKKKWLNEEKKTAIKTKEGYYLGRTINKILQVSLNKEINILDVKARNNREKVLLKRLAKELNH